MADQANTDLVEQLLDELLTGHPEYFKVGFKVKPTNNFKIYIEGDHGITIDQCIKINKTLYKKIEERELFPEGDFSLEISSPGVDAPLQNLRQYKKNIGRLVSVTLNDDTQQTGKLTGVADEAISIEVISGKGRNIVTQVTELPFQNIKTTIVQIQF